MNNQDQEPGKTQLKARNMETETALIDRLHSNLKDTKNTRKSPQVQNGDIRVKLRALLVALLGISLSACAFVSQPVDMEISDEVAQGLNNVTFARRKNVSVGELCLYVGEPCFGRNGPARLEKYHGLTENRHETALGLCFAELTKPTIRLVMGYSKLSVMVTAMTSLLLLLAVMAKEAWWNRGLRWLAVPALLVTALEVVTDASDGLLAAAVRGAGPAAAAHAAGACCLIAVEIVVWYFIAKFFEYSPQEEQNTIEFQ